MVIQLIEMVCNANMGRSIIAELIGNNYLSEIGLSDRYHCISSGTLLNAKGNGELPFEISKRIIELGIDRGLFLPSELEIIQPAILQKNLGLINKYYKKAEHNFEREEVEYRASTLRKFGIKGALKQTPEQTIARKNVIAVFTFDEANVDRLRKIYSDAGLSPIIDILVVYSQSNPETAYGSVFGKDSKAYQTIIENLIIAVHMAIDRLLMSQGLAKHKKPSKVKFNHHP